MKKRSIMLCLICCLGPLVATAVPGSAFAASAPAAPPGSDASSNMDPAAAQLAQDQHLSYSEAAARVNRQDVEAALASGLRAAVDTYAGSWIDQGDGARLVIALTDTSKSDEVHRRAKQAGLDDLVRIVQVSRTATSLAQLNASLSQDIELAGTAATTRMTAGPDLPHNTVNLSYPSDTLTVEQQNFLDRMHAKYGAGLTYVPSAEAAATTACSFPNCDAPLRGGLHIDTPSYNCSSGFNAIDGNGVNRLITAGHCIKNYGTTNTWSERQTDNINHAVGPGYKYTYGTAGDYGIITINDPSSTGWDPRGWVYVRASSGTPSTSEDAQYYISGEGTYTTVPGSYLCHTGYGMTTYGYSGTACGPLSGNMQSVRYVDGTLVNNLSRFNATNCPGDSGGPVYIGHTAYGIVSGTDVTSGCGTVVYYQEISGVLSGFNMTLRHN